MKDKTRKNIIRILAWTLGKIPTPIRRFILFVVSSKWTITIIISLVILLTGLFLSNSLYEYYVKKNYLDIYHSRSVLVSFIRKNLNKAIEIGIVDFSSLYGIVFEDIKISEEEDFSSNKLFFIGKRIDIRLGKPMSKDQILEKVVIYDARLNLDISDPVSSNLLTYIKDFKFPQMEIRNLEFIIRDKDRVIIRTIKPVDVIMKRKGNKVLISMKDKKFLDLIRLQDKIQAETEIDPETGFYGVNIKFTDYNLEKMPGISNTLINLNPDSGISDGFINISKNATDLKIEGNLNIQQFSGDFFPITSIKANNFSINAKFSYLRENVEKGAESYFKRRVNSPEFYYDEQIYTAINGLRKINVSLQIDDMQKLADRLILEDKIHLKGFLKTDLAIEETGKIDNWFIVDGNGFINNLELNIQNPNTDVKNTGVRFLWEKSGDLQVGIKGQIFDREFNLDSKGTIFFNKDKDSGIYPISSDMSLKMSVQSIIMQQFAGYYAKIKNAVTENIKERQEKMLPESYVILSYPYKKFLEKMNLNYSISIDDMKYREDSHSLGPFTISGNSKAGNTSLDLYSTTNPKANWLSLKAMLDRKLPVYEFRAGLQSLIWFDEVFSICDSTIYSDILNFNITVVTSGNNFAELVVNRNMAGEMNLHSINFYRSNPGDLIQFAEMFQGQKRLNLSFGFNGYSQESYFRNIELEGSDSVVKGFGSTQRGDLQLNYSGLLKKQPINGFIIVSGGACQKLKK